MPKTRDSSVQVAVIVAGLLAVVGGAWVFLNSGNEEIITSTQVVNAPSIAQPEIPASDTAIPVDTALQMAEMAFQSGQLTGDEGASALDFYRQVLDQEPDNKRAKAGMALIATQLVDEADELMAKGDYEQVVQRIQALNSIETGSTAAGSLQQQLVEQGNLLFAAMDQQIAAGQLDQAESVARRLRSIPGADTDRIDLAMVQIGQTRQDLEAAAVLEAAAQAAEQERIAASSEAATLEPAVTDGAIGDGTGEVAPVEDFEVIDPAEQVREQIAALLQDAGDKVEEGSLLKPEGANALELYNQVLALESTNAEAKRGLRGIVQQITSSAYDAADEGDIDGARALLDDAETVGIAASLVEQARSDVRDLWVQTESQKVFAVSGFKVQKSVSPKYPKRAMARSVEGWVKVEFTVAEDGRTRDLEVVDSSERLAKQFTNSAIKAVEQWEFEPRVLDGQVIAQRSETTLQFKLTE